MLLGNMKFLAYNLESYIESQKKMTLKFSLADIHRSSNTYPGLLVRYTKPIALAGG